MAENTIPATDLSEQSTTLDLMKLLPLIVLAVAHLPLLWEEYGNLWNKEHYQFFPLALISFGVYFRARRLPGVFHWRPLCWGLVAMDLALLCYSSGLLQSVSGIGINVSPIGGVIGFWLLIWAVCLACSDREVKSSLAYLIILPLITVRPPLGYDKTLILWLQRVTTSVASEILNFFGYLHQRSGVILDFPGMKFEVENACSGVQSLYAVLFLAAFVTCGYRRRFFHTVIVIVSGLLFAAVMNVMRISVIAIAWDSSQIDLTSGFAHDAIGYVALFAAAMLVFSADAFLAFCFDPVPDAKGAGITAIYRNPFVGVWNWLFKVKSRQGEKPRAGVFLPRKLQVPVTVISGILCVSCLYLQFRNLNFF